MARTPSMTVPEAEAVIGPRGRIVVVSSNRATVRKWLVANGLPAVFVAGLSTKELELSYNDVTGGQLKRVRDKLARNSADLDVDDSSDTEPQPAPVEAPVPQTNGHAPATADVEALRVELRINVRDMIAKELDARERANRFKPVEGRTHPMFDRVLQIVANGGNVLLVGPAGCGKTHMSEQIAQSLGLTYSAIHGSAGASESALTGWLLPSDGGKFEYVPAPFVTAYETGSSLFLFDELDAFDPNMLLVANGALANGHLHIAHRKHAPTVKRGHNAFIMATANTYGTGANPMYSGRSPLDAATLDRFIVVDMDYDRELERSIGEAGGLSEGEIQALWSLRDKVRNASLRRTISTRAFQKAITLKRAGDNWQTIIKTLVTGWSADEKAKAGL